MPVLPMPPALPVPAMTTASPLRRSSSAGSMLSTASSSSLASLHRYEQQPPLTSPSPSMIRRASTILAAAASAAVLSSAMLAPSTSMNTEQQLQLHAAASCRRRASVAVHVALRRSMSETLAMRRASVNNCDDVHRVASERNVLHSDNDTMQLRQLPDVQGGAMVAPDALADERVDEWATSMEQQQQQQDYAQLLQCGFMLRVLKRQMLVDFGGMLPDDSSEEELQHAMNNAMAIDTWHPGMIRRCRRGLRQRDRDVIRVSVESETTVASDGGLAMPSTPFHKITGTSGRWTDDGPIR